MSLDGLRAWIGEVERKLGKRTRVFLALSVIAIGIGGAAIYLAIDARSNAVSEADVQELQEQLEAQIGAGGGAPADDEAVAQLESQVQALRAEVAQLREGGGGKGASGGGGGGGSGGAGTGGGNPDAAQEKLQELLEDAQDQAEAGK